MRTAGAARWWWSPSEAARNHAHPQADRPPREGAALSSADQAGGSLFSRGGPVEVEKEPPVQATPIQAPAPARAPEARRPVAVTASSRAAGRISATTSA